MASQSLLTLGSTAASAEFTVPSGSQATISLKGSQFPAIAAVIELKDDVGNFVPLGYLGSRDVAQNVGAGDFRVTRPAGSNCGVFRG